MCKATLLITLILLLSQCLDAQVKREYKDSIFTDHTVVVKESEEVSDLDILNAHVDIDEFALGEVVRITTEKELVPDGKTLPIPKAQVPIAEVQRKDPVILAITIEAEPIPAKSKNIKVAPTISVVRNSQKQKTRRVSKVKSKRNKRFKNKKFSFSKRKKDKRRVGQNKKRCYLF